MTLLAPGVGGAAGARGAGGDGAGKRAGPDPGDPEHPETGASSRPEQPDAAAHGQPPTVVPPRPPSPLGNAAPVTVTALILAVVLVFGFAVYGLVRVVGDDGRSGSAGAAPGGPSATGTAVDGARTGLGLRSAEAVLPGPESMPPGWTPVGEAETTAVAPERCHSGCWGLLSEGQVVYAEPGTGHRAFVQVEAYESAVTAVAGYQKRADQARSADGVGLTYLEPFGDESLAFARDDHEGAEPAYSMATLIRAGTVVLRVTYGGGDDRVETPVVAGLAHAVTERARQAQHGEEPSAAFTG